MNNLVRDCSHHGILVDDQCICYSGWTAIGDFAIINGVNCDISANAVNGLAWTSLVLAILVLIFYSHFFIKRIRKSAKLTSKMIFVLTFLFLAIIIIYWNIGLILEPQYAVIGRSIMYTFLLNIGYATAYCGCVQYLNIAMDFLKGIERVMSPTSQAKMIESIKHFRDSINYMYISITMICFAPTLALGAPKHLYYISGKVYLLGMAVWTVAFLLMFNPPLTLIRHELKSTIEDSIRRNVDCESLQKLRFNLLVVKIAVSSIFGATVVMYSIFALWDILLRKTEYITLFCAISVNGLSLPMIMTLSKPSPLLKKIIGMVSSGSLSYRSIISFSGSRKRHAVTPELEAQQNAEYNAAIDDRRVKSNVSSHVSFLTISAIANAITSPRVKNADAADISNRVSVVMTTNHSV